MPKWKDNLKKRKRYTRRKIRSTSGKLKRSRLLLKAAKIGFVIVVAGFLSLFLLIPVFAINLPSPDKVVRREGFSTKILDRNGEVLYDIFQDERRTPVDIENIPLQLRQATIAIEDKNFYEHQGFDPLGMIRGFSRLFTRGYAQGGSTLTQQLVKNVLLTPERSIWRKIKEFVLAVQIERKYEKDEILQMYLNEAPYGGNMRGVQTASETYFGKSVSELRLVESAILAGLPQRPTYYSPYSSNPDAFKERTKQVLRRMREDGYISEDDEKNALEELENLEFQDRSATFKAPHFVQYVQEKLEERYGASVIEQGGFKVTTTLDLNLQQKAQEIVYEEIDKVKNLNISNGAAVVLDPETSEILAMVGSKNFDDPDYDGQVNVTTALRQPGSAIKPITYAAALENGYTASTLIMDVPTKFRAGEGQPYYEPVNYDGRYRGPVQVRYALANSLNVPAVKMLAMVGMDNMLSLAYDMGIESLEPTRENKQRLGLSVTLGGGEVKLLELTSAFGSFMNGGHKVEPISILRIEDIDGKVIEENEPKKGKSVLSEGVAFVIADILSDNQARSAVFGTNSLLNVPGYDVAVKTGTTNDRRDNWAVGGNKNAVIGVWVGNNDNSPMTSVASGVSGASPIWRRITIAALESKPKVTFEPPSSVVQLAVDSVSGYAAHDGFPERLEYFVKGTEPGEDPIHVKLKVCRNDGKLATPSDVSAGNYEEKEYFLFKEEDPTGEPNLWQESVLAWMFAQSDERYHPPTEYCGQSNPVFVGFDNPRHEQSNLDNEFQVKIRAESTTNLTKVELYVNDSLHRTFESRPFEHNLSLNNGKYSLKAKAYDSEGRTNENTINIGVGVKWDEPNPTPTSKPTSTPNIPIED